MLAAISRLLAQPASEIKANSKTDNRIVSLFPCASVLIGKAPEPGRHSPKKKKGKGVKIVGNGHAQHHRECLVYLSHDHRIQYKNQLPAAHSGPGLKNADS